MSRFLSISVTDATHRAPAYGLQVDLYRLGERATKLCSARVAASGLVEDPALAEPVESGEYELVFHVGAYYRRLGHQLPAIPLLEEVPFRFGVDAGRTPIDLPFRISPRGFALAAEALA